MFPSVLSFGTQQNNLFNENSNIECFVRNNQRASENINLHEIYKTEHRYLIVMFEDIIIKLQPIKKTRKYTTLGRRFCGNKNK